jgi:hypothetical protein
MKAINIEMAWRGGDVMASAQRIININGAQWRNGGVISYGEMALIGAESIIERRNENMA